MEFIAVASDHAGYELKNVVSEYLKSKGYGIKDFGCFSKESCDYADFAHPLADAIERDNYSRGLVFCGSGNGINMTVNKHQGIRSAICWNKEIAVLARHHNDANICSIPARFLSTEEALDIIDVFMKEPFDGGRHLNRIQKIPVGNVK
jgi:ribose 5-phosphate isomerase B